MRLILCTGMMRSGSTWSYNVCRLVGAMAAKQLNLPFGSTYLDGKHLDNFIRNRAPKRKGIMVIKSHFPGALALKLIKLNRVNSICTLRDPRDCIASRQVFNEESFEKSVRFIKGNLSYVDFYQNAGSTLFIRYEEMKSDPAAKIRDIAAYLRINLTDQHVADIHERTSMEKAAEIAEAIESRPREELIRDRDHYVDPETNLHEGHIRGGKIGRWKDELSAEQIETITRELGPWLVRLGYETEESLQQTQGEEASG